MQQAAFPGVSTGLSYPALAAANGRVGDLAALRGEQHAAALEGLLQAQRNGQVRSMVLASIKDCLLCVRAWQ
jgi:O-succinylbenzoate synthase